jgi:hypothetical protein
MRLVLVAIVAVLGCDEPPGEDPLALKPIANLPPPLPKPAAPAEEKTFDRAVNTRAKRVPGEPPSAEDRLSPFELTVGWTSPRWPAEGVDRLKGDGFDAVATHTRSKRGETTEAEDFRLSTAEARTFLDSLDPLLWWTLGNEGSSMMDGTYFTVELRRGSRHIKYKLHNECGCKYGCGCPQRELISQFEDFLDGLRARAHALTAPAWVETFKPPALSGKPKECAGAECDSLRCFPQGALLACFRSPFGSSKTALLKPVKGKRVAHKAVTDDSFVWAFELENGTRCAGPPEPAQRALWLCEESDGRQMTADVAITVRGKAQVASLSRGQARRITRLWK